MFPIKPPKDHKVVALTLPNFKTYLQMYSNQNTVVLAL